MSVSNLAACGLTAATPYEVKAWTKCQAWRTTGANPALQLALRVNGDCSIQVNHAGGARMPLQRRE